jgi:hypothetical protein
MFPKEELERYENMKKEALRSMEPVLDMIKDANFQYNLQKMNVVANQVRDALESVKVLDVPMLHAMENLYSAVDQTSLVIAKAYSVPEEKREEIITRPIYSDTKLQIRKGTMSFKEILPLKLPPDTRWSDVRVRFVDRHNVFIEIFKHKVKITADYNDMGMYDARTKNPNAQWTIFYNFAEHDGEITWKTPVASFSVKKNKQLLSKALKLYFNIKDDPFMVYQKEKAYKLKMTVIPNETTYKNETSEVEDYFNEMTPKVYKKDQSEKS